MEDHLNALRTEWVVAKEKWFYGEQVDPVFEGTVRDFCEFDNTLQELYKAIENFMRSCEGVCKGVMQVAEAVVAGMAKEKDPQIAAESCKLKEASNQITRQDAPHAAIAKLRRDMDFNILTPMRQHLMNNRNLKTMLEQRRRRLMEYKSSKKAMEKVADQGKTSKKYLSAEATLQSAKALFVETDKSVFEWLYILDEYKGDILDSTIQTIKYLQYEFFASSAHALSTVLPKRMEFRPMVEMTPEHLENQVDIELQEDGDVDEEPVTDFGMKLISKLEKDGRGVDETPNVIVDPLSLSSLLSQGFDEMDARRALRMHNNDTQAAMDWIVNGGQEGPSQTDIQDGVRMPTTIRRIQKLRQKRKEEKERRAQRKRVDQQRMEGSQSSTTPADPEPQQQQHVAPPGPPGPPVDLLSLDDPATAPSSSSASKGGMIDLLSMDNGSDLLDVGAPTDFSKVVTRQSVPEARSFAGEMSAMTGELSRDQLMQLLASGQQLNPAQLAQVQTMLAGPQNPQPTAPSLQSKDPLDAMFG